MNSEGGRTEDKGNIVDADTLELRIGLGFGVAFTDRFRLSGIDARETSGPERDSGLAAAAALQQQLAPFAEILVRTHKNLADEVAGPIAIQTGTENGR